ncbi:SRPBCC family protein [Paenibacillus beijingensis]|uniref:ATPase n=1 Tax=Paenibacillus beijingensis TaxID=1126833 RepID=A0A0D5NDP8_9BACL|nr:SRPBCC domain-containing protein [Paenibacillus beijingensis]AJY73519.1 ATPase [Paenibacillus beijingensis]
MAENDVSESVTTSSGDRDFVMERFFNSPRELVFKAFTEPEHVARWWGPFGFTIPVCRIDLRPGGIWHYCMRSPEGDEHWVRSEYREITRPERIVYVSTFADKDGNPVDGIPEQLFTIMFSEDEGKTKLTIRIAYGSAEDLKATLEMGMVQGLTITLNQLADYLSEIQ